MMATSIVQNPTQGEKKSLRVSYVHWGEKKKNPRVLVLFTGKKPRAAIFEESGTTACT
jgi:hypothetical protein